ncbi:MAG: putative F0F1-ATPase subunit Ca2+/Mg2+ transporter [Firmicutes bacterium]|nr:putative F0F1-ATPase subunit Ca2+/Mg2+ transporter [Bacillota bacterium]
MPEKPGNTWAALGVAGNIGLTMVATIAVGLFGGRWLDNFFASSPWCTVSGIVVGMLAGLWSTYKKIIKL